MFYLIAAIMCSASISIVMRLFESKVKNNMCMFVANYIICAILSFSYMENKQIFVSYEGFNFVLFLGIISGILYLASFVLMQINIRKNGVVLSATFMKLGVLIPTIMAIVVFKEQPGLLQIAGIILAVIAIIIINYDKEDVNIGKYKYLLVVLLVGSGITDSTSNIFDKLGNGLLEDHYMLFTFGMACICSLVMLVYQKQHFLLKDFLVGALIGIPNYFSTRFTLMALETLPAVIIYPVYSVAGIVLISIISVILFKEKLSKRKLVAMGIIIAALVCLKI